MLHCRDCSSYRGEGLGTCFIWSIPFGGDSRPVCGSFTPLIPEQRDTTTIAGKFAEALGCLTDGIDWLQRIDDQHEERYPNDECEESELSFWSEIYEALHPLRGLLESLEAVEKHVPKEIIA